MLSRILNGETVISYRGTDNQSVWYDPISGAGDILNGWTIGAGFAAASQAALAEQFYKDITTQAVFDGAAPSNLVLTGHSLGGGLAAFIATLTGASATIFDNMPFGAAAVAATISQDVSLGLNISDLFSNSSALGTQYASLPTPAAVTQIVTSGEILEGARVAAPAASALLFSGAGPVVSTAASLYGAYLDTSVSSNTLSSYAGSSADIFELHSQALNVFLLYAQQKNLTDCDRHPVIGPV